MEILSTSKFFTKRKGFTMEIDAVGKFGLLIEIYGREHWRTIIINILIFEIVLTIYNRR